MGFELSDNLLADTMLNIKASVVGVEPMVGGLCTTGYHKGGYVRSGKDVVDASGSSRVGCWFVFKSKVGAQDISEVMFRDHASNAIQIGVHGFIEIAAEDNLVFLVEFGFEECVEGSAELAARVLISDAVLL